MREHHGSKRIDFVPDSDQRSVFNDAFVTAEYASVTPSIHDSPLVYAHPDQLRVMAALYTAMAIRMEYLQLAATAAAKPNDAA